MGTLDLTHDDGWWSARIAELIGADRPEVGARTPDHVFRGVNRPVRFYCSDGHYYVVKGPLQLRHLIAEHVTGRLGALLRAPVAPVVHVEVTAAVTGKGSMANHLKPGILHGSKFIEGCQDSRYCNNPQEPENVLRYARLAVLYGLVDASDIQFLFKVRNPRHVYSIDHDQFLPGGHDWSLESLQIALQQDCRVDQMILNHVTISDAVLKGAISRLSTIDDNRIAQVVGTVPIHWGITQEERIGLGQFLAARRNQLLERYT